MSICGQSVGPNVKFKGIHAFHAAKRKNLGVIETSFGGMTGSPNTKAMTLIANKCQKSAVRNFLLAFAPGELIISLLLLGGSNYLFKICFLVYFPLLASYVLGVVFSSYLLRRRSFCCSSSFFSMPAPFQPHPAALAALQNPDPDPQAPAEQAVQTLNCKLPLHKLLVKCKRYGLRFYLIYCATLSRFSSCRL